MKKLNMTFLLIVLLNVLSVETTAHDIEVANSDGATIFYNYIDNRSLEVTFRGNNSSGDDYAGNIIIPESIIYNGKPYTVVRIGDQAFWHCKSMTSITIPYTVTSIGNGNAVFCGCLNLTSVIVDLGNSEFDSRNNCNAIIRTFSDELITGCKSTIIPNSVCSIGCAAFGYTDMKSILIPNSVSRIGEFAFSSCIELESVTIPNSVTSIGDHAFSYCSNLRDVYCYAMSVPNIDSDAFQDTSIENINLHVPESAINDYKAVTPWNSFNIVALKYNLTYMIDGAIYKSYKYRENETIPVEAAPPAKEGYSFSGWSPIPTNMPANDVEVTGSYIVNKYKLTYIVDGEIYKTADVDYGSPIIPEEPLVRTGYSFFGWSWIPSKMPSEDVTIIGTFIPNKYKLTYKVDGVDYKTIEVVYGMAITPEAAPTKEGYTFTGWKNLPETMPAKDHIVNGSFVKNMLGKCATPTITFDNNELLFGCETEGVSYVYTIATDGANGTSKSGKVSLSPYRTISVYATKTDYENSDVATKEINIQKNSIKGDVNGDGRVNATDITEVINIILHDGESFKTCPDDNHPHLIDLGLPSGTKRACYNVGASKPEDEGGRYAWGETTTKSKYYFDTYKYSTGFDNFEYIGSDISGTQYDAATVNWGASWCMPTYEQIKELVNNTTAVETSQNGVFGLKISGSNGSTIFLPEVQRFYWSSTLSENNPTCAELLELNNYYGNQEVSYYDNIWCRVYGWYVRPVHKK